ncbi:hypothetical protein PTI98_010270 [Pleurotus ostreatus]|nr:hypothetical protein PTI98_010270 [Pleurotus ostreatus]
MEEVIPSCAQELRIILSITYGSIAILFYDYLLAFNDELYFLGKAREGRRTATRYLYLVVRYAGASAALLSLFSYSRPVTLLCGSLMFLVALSSNALLAVRTYALWLRSRKTAVSLSFVALILLIPTSIVVGFEYADKSFIQYPITSFVKPASNPTCRYDNVDTPTSPIFHTRFHTIPSLLCMLFNLLNLTLASIVIFRWRRSSKISGGSHIADMLWADGLLYAFSVVAFTILQLVFESKIPPLLRPVTIQ